MNVWFLLAGALSLVGVAVHLVAGARYGASPLLAVAASRRATVALTFMSWHAVTLQLAIMALVFLAAAFGHAGRDAVLVAIALAASILAVSVVGPLKVGLNPLRFAPTLLTVAIVALALAGL